MDCLKVSIDRYVTAPVELQQMDRYRCFHANLSKQIVVCIFFIKNLPFLYFSEKNIISVYNTGKGIPVEMNSQGDYVPELIFGDMFTSSNYDDNEKKVE